MQRILRSRVLLMGMLAAATFAMSGCGGSDTGGAVHNHGEDGAETVVDHSHGGWWCTEHGVPEGECARCDSSLVASFKEKGDWCDEHDRPESQCFICSPARFDKFAARYEAKTGHKPPAPEE